MTIRQWIRNQWEGFLDFRHEVRMCNLNATAEFVNVSSSVFHSTIYDAISPMANRPGAIRDWEYAIGHALIEVASVCPQNPGNVVVGLANAIHRNSGFLEDFKLAANLFVMCRGQGYMGFRDRETLAGILGIKGIMGMDPWELEHWFHASAKGLAK